MRKGMKLGLLVFTLYPILYSLYFIAAVMRLFVVLDDPSSVAGVFPMIFLMHMFAMLAVVVLLIIYVIHAVRNERLSQEMRIIWVLLMLFGHVIAMPVYWFFHIWKDGDVHMKESSDSYKT